MLRPRTDPIDHLNEAPLRATEVGPVGAAAGTARYVRIVWSWLRMQTTVQSGPLNRLGPADVGEGGYWSPSCWSWS